ncbi:hypothetical protein Tco_1065332 [Tanacetum coccineum]
MILTIYSPLRPILQSSALGLSTWINGVSEVSVYASRRKGEYEYSRTLKNSKVFFSTPTAGIFGEVGVNIFRNAIGAHYLPHSSEYVTPPSIDIVRQWFPTTGYREAVSAKGTLKKSLFHPSLANGINIDCASIFGEDIIFKLNKKHKERVIPYSRFLSLLMMHKMKGYGDGDVTLNPTQVFNVNNLGTEAKPT